MICDNCGTESATQFCGSCGQKMPVIMTCDNCGTESATQFCGSCGQKMPGNESNEAIAVELSHQQSK